MITDDDYFSPGDALGDFSFLMECADATEHTSPSGRVWRFAYEYPGYFVWVSGQGATRIEILATPDHDHNGEIQIERAWGADQHQDALQLVNYNRLTVTDYLAICVPLMDAEPGPDVVPERRAEVQTYTYTSKVIP